MYATHLIVGSIYGVPVAVAPFSVVISRSNKCRAEGCTENHRFHICKYCGDRDSSHCSKDCPTLSAYAVSTSAVVVPACLATRGIKGVSVPPPTPTASSSRCGVPGCYIGHSSHYCNVCCKSGVTHKDEDCPRYKSRDYRRF